MFLHKQALCRRFWRCAADLYGHATRDASSAKRSTQTKILLKMQYSLIYCDLYMYILDLYILKCTTNVLGPFSLHCCIYE